MTNTANTLPPDLVAEMTAVARRLGELAPELQDLCRRAYTADEALSEAIREATAGLDGPAQDAGIERLNAAAGIAEVRELAFDLANALLLVSGWEPIGDVPWAFDAALDGLR